MQLGIELLKSVAHLLEVIFNQNIPEQPQQLLQLHQLEQRHHNQHQVLQLVHILLLHLI